MLFPARRGIGRQDDAAAVALLRHEGLRVRGSQAGKCLRMGGCLVAALPALDILADRLWAPSGFAKVACRVGGVEVQLGTQLTGERFQFLVAPFEFGNPCIPLARSWTSRTFHATG